MRISPNIGQSPNKDPSCCVVLYEGSLSVDSQPDKEK
jgi:hypothetical protein